MSASVMFYSAVDSIKSVRMFNLWGLIMLVAPAVVSIALFVFFISHFCLIVWVLSFFLGHSYGSPFPPMWWEKKDPVSHYNEKLSPHDELIKIKNEKHSQLYLKIMTSASQCFEILTQYFEILSHYFKILTHYFEKVSLYNDLQDLFLFITLAEICFHTF